MCLYVSTRNPKSLRFKNGKITCYKVVNSYSDRLITEYQYFTLVSGYNTPLGTLDDTGIIHGGVFHVYTNKKYALRHCSSDNIVIPVICHAVNFIAKGDRKDACFTKIFISKNVYTKALKSKYKSELFRK